MITVVQTIMEKVRQQASERPGQEALIFLNADGVTERLSYRDLLSAVQHRSSYLRRLPLYSRVGLTSPHGPAFLIDALAIIDAGHCLVPINGAIPAVQRDELTERAGIHALFEHGASDLRIFPGKPIDQAGDDDFRALAPAYLRFTSGSTGQRKGVLLGHRAILERTETANKRLQISHTDRVLCLLSMVDHFVISILLYLRNGATILLVEEEKDAGSMAEQEKATVIYGAPTQFVVFNRPIPSLRLAVSTTEPLSESIATQFLSATGQAISQALGIIEAGLLTLNDRKARTHPLQAGVPMADYQLTVTAEKGLAGEIHVAGPGLLDAYVSPWRNRSSLLGPHGFATGDHGWIDEEGSLHLIGRGKNRIDLNGKTFFSEEIEAVINRHPMVWESLVLQEGSGIVAQVVPRNDALTSAHLVHWLNQNLSHSQATVEIRIVRVLPKTATGKLARPRLSQRLILRQGR